MSLSNKVHTVIICLQITIPCGRSEGGPIALGIIGPRGSDESLLEIAEQLYPLLK